LKGHVAGNTNLSKENESAFYLFIISKEKENELGPISQSADSIRPSRFNFGFFSKDRF